jgi:nucleotidyltransferase/DNA polymerase involved in DNA repair
MLPRKIVHIDMDAFYASVVCAASYEARKVGVRSAMPAVRAGTLSERRYGVRLYQLARGVDESQVVPDRPTQSISAENTFEHDVPLTKSSRWSADSAN